MADDAMREAVIAFVCRTISCQARDLMDETRLRYDLGIDGEDAEDLFECFSREFSVDVSQLNLRDYFGPDAGATPWTVGRKFFGDQEHRRPQITIRDFVTTAQRGRW
jgi:hypothetical protein